MTAGFERAAFRPEAQPALFKDLDQRQQAAFQRIVELLAAGVTSTELASSGSPVRTGPFLDLHRSSRTVLVSGQRGTGKTTLLLSLARAVRDVSLSSPVGDELTDAVKEQLALVRRRIVWLDTLDMEPLPTSANLLGGVLARIEAAVSERLGGRSATSPTSFLSPDYDTRDAMDELRRLQTTVALTFDGNISSRAGNLDPDAFAAEVSRTERERVALDERFIDVLGKVSRAIGSPSGEAPLFVLPVDDLDLNPAACVPMLELLRAAYAPHLLVLLLADQDLVQAILRIKYRSDLARMAKPTDLDDSERWHAQNLADNAMRKHLPPHQRVSLAKLTPVDALAFRPLGSDGPPLAQVLGSIELAQDVLFLPDGEPLPGPRLLVTAEREQGHREWSGQWRSVLNVTFRELVDLYLELQSDLQRQRAPWALHKFAHQQVEQLWARNGRSGPRFSAEIRPEMSWRTERRAGLVQVRTATVNRLDVLIGGEVPMSVEDAATFVAATDIVGDGVAGAYPRGLSVSLRQSFLPLAEAPLNSRSRVGRSYQVDWPMIGHTTPWGYGRAERMLADAESSWQGQPNPLHGAWIMVMTALIEEALSERRQVVPSRRPKPVRQWDSLVHQVVALPRDEFVDEWLISIGWLCTPEMGWDIEYAPPPVPRDLLQEIESRRREHYSRLPADSMASADSWRIPLRG